MIDFDEEIINEDEPKKKPTRKNQHKLGYDRNSKAYDRRRLIKKIIKEKGFIGVTELKRLLEDEYNVHAMEHTLVKDLSNIEAIPAEDVDAFNNTIIAKCEMYLKDIEELVENAVGSNKAKMIRMYMASVKDMSVIVNLLREKPEIDKIPQSPIKPRESVTVMFDDG